MTGLGVQANAKPESAHVAPVEGEETRMTHPGLNLASVTGVPDGERDEVLAAVVVPKPGTTLSAAQLDAFCRESLAAYKVPRRIRFVGESELPLTTTGKLQKNRLAGLFFGDRAGNE